MAGRFIAAIWSVSAANWASHGLCPAGRPTRVCAVTCGTYPTFRNLPDQVIDQLAEDARFQGFLRGQSVFVPGDQGRGLYIVVKGRVRVHRISLEGREQTPAGGHSISNSGRIVIFRPGQRHSNHALCLESSTTLILPLARLIALTDAFPVLAQAFLREFSQRIQDLEERLEETALLTLEQRVARLLLEKTNRSNPVPREMAAYLGAARESVSRVLLRFAKDGLVRKEGRVSRFLTAAV